MPNDALVKEIREHLGHQWSDRSFVQSEKVRDIMRRAASALEANPPSAAVDEGRHPEVQHRLDNIEEHFSEVISTATPSPVVGAGVTDETLAGILEQTLGKTGYVFLASSISHDKPKFHAVMMDAMRQASALSTTPPAPQGVDAEIKQPKALGWLVRWNRQPRYDEVQYFERETEAAAYERELTENGWTDPELIGLYSWADCVAALRRVPATVVGELQNVLERKFYEFGCAALPDQLSYEMVRIAENCAEFAVQELQRRIAGTQKVGP